MDEIMIQKVERLQKMYDYARSNNLCKNKATFADLVGFAASNISRAFSGVPRYLTDSLLTRINQAIGCPFSTSWVLYGEGDMFAQSAPAAPEQEVSVSTHQPVQEVVVSSDPKRVELLESLVKTLQHEVDLLERYNNHLEEENEALKKGNSYVYVRAKDA
jgi:hypothetical protein